jgi:hypothetical protein
LVGGLGDAEIDYLGKRLSILLEHQNIARFQVTMEDAFLVRVLHGVTDGLEDPQALPWIQAPLVAVLGNRHPGTYSMTKKGRHVSLVPASKIRAMWGCSIIASA